MDVGITGLVATGLSPGSMEFLNGALDLPGRRRGVAAGCVSAELLLTFFSLGWLIGLNDDGVGRAERS